MDDSGAHVVLRVRVNVLQKLHERKEKVFLVYYAGPRVCSIVPDPVHRIHMFLAGSGSGSISQRNGSADPDPDPHQNGMDPGHWFVRYSCAYYSLSILRDVRIQTSVPDP